MDKATITTTQTFYVTKEGKHFFINYIDGERKLVYKIERRMLQAYLFCLNSILKDLLTIDIHGNEKDCIRKPAHVFISFDDTCQVEVDVFKNYYIQLIDVRKETNEDYMLFIRREHLSKIIGIIEGALQ